MSLIGIPGYRPPDTVWNHVMIWGHMSNRSRHAYKMSSQRYPKAKRRVFYPHFSMQIFIREHPRSFYTFGKAQTGTAIVRRRMMLERHDAKRKRLDRQRRRFRS